MALRVEEEVSMLICFRQLADVASGMKKAGKACVRISSPFPVA